MSVVGLRRKASLMVCKANDRENADQLHRKINAARHGQRPLKKALQRHLQIFSTYFWRLDNMEKGK